MAKVFDFTAKLNERRAAAKIAEMEVAREQVVNAKMNEAADLFQAGNLLGALVAFDDAQKAQEPVNNPCAYCDPSNEFKGSKYEASRGLRNTELAKLMREDIKSAVKRGLLDKGFKVSVRCDSFSMGCSIDIRITALPAGVAVYTPEYLEATGNLQHPARCTVESRYTPAVEKALRVLEEIHSSYQRDNSDSMSDYFDRRYYGDVEIDWRLK